jgi:hypothetical protein
MIDLKVQLYWARVKGGLLQALLFKVSILPTHPRDSEAAKQRKLSVLMRAIPNAKLKKPPPKKGWRLFWGDTSRFTGHLARFTQS